MAIIYLMCPLVFQFIDDGVDAAIWRKTNEFYYKKHKLLLEHCESAVANQRGAVVSIYMSF